MVSTVLLVPGESLEAQCAARTLEAAGVVTTTTPSPEVELVLLFVVPGAQPSCHADTLALPGCPILLVSRRLDAAAHQLAADVDAAGLVSWSTPTGALVEAIDSLVRGEAQRPVPVEEQADPVQTLTGRERQVAELLGQGATNEAIASTLGISYHTVRTHVAHVLAKLGVSHRYAAGALARQSNRERVLPDESEVAVS